MVLSQRIKVGFKLHQTTLPNFPPGIVNYDPMSTVRYCRYMESDGTFCVLFEEAASSLARLLGLISFFFLMLWHIAQTGSRAKGGEKWIQVRHEATACESGQILGRRVLDAHDEDRERHRASGPLHEVIAAGCFLSFLRVLLNRTAVGCAAWVSMRSRPRNKDPTR